MNREGVKPYAAAVRRAAMLAAAVLLTACTSMPTAGRGPDLSRISVVAVMPVQNMAAIYGAFRNVRNPLSGRVFTTGEVSGDAAAWFETAVTTRAGALKRFRVLPPDNALGVMSTLTANRDENPLDRTLWLQAGASLGADAVLIGFLYRFDERVGSKYAVEKPASVAFELYLMGRADGRVLWSGRYEETQKSLSENLLDLDKFIKRRGWLTAQQLAASGLDNLFDALAPPRPPAYYNEMEP